MNTATEAQARTLATLLGSPVAQAALAEAEAARHAERRDLLAKIAAAERTAAAAGVEISKPIPELRERHAAALAALRVAAHELNEAEAEARVLGLSHEAGVRALRGGLGALGGDAIEATRHSLLIDRRGAMSLDDFKVTTEPSVRGELHQTVRVDRGGAGRLRQIDDRLAELDRMMADPALSPGAIEARCAAILAEVAAGPAPVLGSERTFPENPDRQTHGAAVRSIIWKYLRRSH